MLMRMGEEDHEPFSRWDWFTVFRCTQSFKCWLVIVQSMSRYTRCMNVSENKITCNYGGINILILKAKAQCKQIKIVKKCGQDFQFQLSHLSWRIWEQDKNFRMVATKLYVGNIPENHNSLELRQMFDKYGKVVEFDILKDFGFVHYESENEAKSAVDALDGINHRGQSIKVEMSRSQVRQRPGMGGKGECYRCGGDGHWSKECPKGPTRGRGRGGRDNRDMSRDRNGGGFRRGGGSGSGGFSTPYYSDPYDYYSRRPPAPHPYDRLRYDPYERRVPPTVPPRDYYGYSRDGPDFYRRSPPPRDPYYDYYMKRRYEALDRYGDAPDRSSAGASQSKDDMKKPLMRTPMQSRIPGRVPGPY